MVWAKYIIELYLQIWSYCSRLRERYSVSVKFEPQSCQSSGFLVKYKRYFCVKVSYSFRNLFVITMSISRTVFQQSHYRWTGFWQGKPMWDIILQEKLQTHLRGRTPKAWGIETISMSRTTHQLKSSRHSLIYVKWDVKCTSLTYLCDRFWANWS